MLTLGRCGCISHMTGFTGSHGSSRRSCALAAYADGVHWIRAEADDWITSASLSFAGAGIILRVGIGLRWPFAATARRDPLPLESQSRRSSARRLSPRGTRGACGRRRACHAYRRCPIYSCSSANNLVAVVTSGGGGPARGSGRAMVGDDSGGRGAGAPHRRADDCGGAAAAGFRRLLRDGQPWRRATSTSGRIAASSHRADPGPWGYSVPWASARASVIALAPPCAVCPPSTGISAPLT